MSRINKLLVYENWTGMIPNKIGTLYVDESKGKEIMSFEYDENWLLNADDKLVFDPDLNLYKGRQYAPLNKDVFGVFSDSCPDRWGETLMKRRELILAKKEERKPRRLTKFDYLLGVYDETRMGGLRFAIEENVHIVIFCLVLPMM